MEINREERNDGRISAVTAFKDDTGGKIGQLNQAGTTTICTHPGVEADIGSWITDLCSANYIR